MSFDIYVCHLCYWPVWFPFGMKMHIGTGWYCWKSHQNDEPSLEDALPVDITEEVFSALKKPYICEQVCERAKQLFSDYLKTKKYSRLLFFLRRQLKQGRGDVIRSFLRLMARQNDPAVTKLLRRLTATHEWLIYAPQLLKTDKAAKPSK